MKRKMLTYDEVMAKYYSHLTKDDLENEIWRPAIVDGEASERYMVSNLGRFADRTPPRIYHNYGMCCDIPGFGRVQMINVSAHPTKSKKNASDDYLCVRLDRKTHLTHIVVASTFIRPLAESETVDHVEEGNVFDNRVGNLQILSRRDNKLKGSITASYKTGIPIGCSPDTRRRKWRVCAPQDVFGTKLYVARFKHFEPAAVCAATICRRYCRCDSDAIRELLLKSYEDLADYTLTDAEQADVYAKIAAFEERNADIIKEIGVQADA